MLIEVALDEPNQMEQIWFHFAQAKRDPSL
jgi:hypothetical protein